MLAASAGMLVAYVGRTGPRCPLPSGLPLPRAKPGGPRLTVSSLGLRIIWRAMRSSVVVPCIPFVSTVQALQCGRLVRYCRPPLPIVPPSLRVTACVSGLASAVALLVLLVCELNLLLPPPQSASLSTSRTWSCRARLLCPASAGSLPRRGVLCRCAPVCSVPPTCPVVTPGVAPEELGDVRLRPVQKAHCAFY